MEGKPGMMKETTVKHDVIKEQQMYAKKLKMKVRRLDSLFRNKATDFIFILTLNIINAWWVFQPMIPRGGVCKIRYHSTAKLSCLFYPL